MSEWNVIVKTSVDAKLDAEEFDLDDLTDESVEALATTWVDEISNDKCKDAWRVQLSWYSAYADGSDSGPKGVLTGDWNRVSRTAQNLLERAGYTIDWCDQVSMCDGCCKAIQTQPTHYGWKPRFHVSDDVGLYCEDCTLDSPDALLDELRGNPAKALTLDSINLADHGYARVEQTFEAGWHPGQDDSPKAIAAALRERGVEDFIFVLDDQGQFDARFSVWVPEDDLEAATGVEGKCEVAPNVALDRALRNLPV